MHDLEYSLEALNAKNAFYRAKTIIYVEGDDDLMFWNAVFSLVPNFAFEIESVGGSPELDKYIEKIEAGLLDAIAARDADFLRFESHLSASARVIYTHGYAIENSLYTADVLHHMAQSWCRSPKITQAQCVNWLNDLAASFAPLVILDIANAISSAGVPVLPDNCTRFMKSQASAQVCQNKVAQSVKATTSRLTKEAISNASTAFMASAAFPLDYIRGHLLASAVMKFLIETAKQLGKKISISLNALYAAAMENFSFSLSSAHPHRAYYNTAASAAAVSFTK